MDGRTTHLTGSGIVIETGTMKEKGEKKEDFGSI